MMPCPCHECPERRLVCHDFCPVYLAYHEERVEAREALRREQPAARYLIEQTIRIEKRLKVKRSR